MHKVITQEMYSQPAEGLKEKRVQQIQKLCGSWGNILGMLVGFVCLTIGLISSGRLVF